MSDRHAGWFVLPPTSTDRKAAPMRSPYAKAIAVAVLGVIATVTQGIVTEEWNAGELQTAIAALVTALTVYAVPNRAKTTTTAREGTDIATLKAAWEANKLPAPTTTATAGTLTVTSKVGGATVTTTVKP